MTPGNKAIDVLDKDRASWFVECEDYYSRAIGNSSFRWFDVDLSFASNYLIIPINLNFPPTIYVEGCIKYNCTSGTDGCDTLGVCL